MSLSKHCVPPYFEFWYVPGGLSRTSLGWLVCFFGFVFVMDDELGSLAVTCLWFAKKVARRPFESRAIED